MAESKVIHTISIKPLSVNEGYQGRRFKTPRFKAWENSVLILLPKIKLPEPPFQIYLRFGFSSSSSDWDNGIKHFTDCLAKKYGFNDKLVRRAIIDTEIVPKGSEFIQWELAHLNLE